MTVLPNNDSSCGWVETLSPRKAKPALTQNKRAKWVIIGAGYSGLSAALTLAEQLPDEEIVLIDANRAGEGASSRNSGYLVDSTLNDGHLSDTGLTAYKTKYELNLIAIDCVSALTEKYNIDCQWNPCGKYHASADLATETKLRNFNQLLTTLNIDNDFIQGEQLASQLGTDFYKMAVKTQGGVMLQPAALARGMLNALPANVTLYENTPVTAIKKGSPHTISCQGGELIADKLIVCVNGFMPSLGIKKNRIFPLLLTASLTRTLTHQEQQKMNFVDEWGVLSANAMGATLRYTQDKRLMIRNTVEVSSSLQLNKAALAKRQKIHLMSLQKRFNFLPADIFQHCWSGVTCISANNANVFERLSSNYWAVGCYNGGGIGLATLFGQQMAYQAMDKPEPTAQLIYQRPQASWLPPQPFLNLGIRAKLSIDRWGAKGDN
ncbi:MAG: glycine/D-amino acid oxidase-like deaminating enzyme [Paraglaciecola sp.]|jgi:glycine/D-amino acid oxidase-like deaminating enzyme